MILLKSRTYSNSTKESKLVPRATRRPRHHYGALGMKTKDLYEEG